MRSEPEQMIFEYALNMVFLRVVIVWLFIKPFKHMNPRSEDIFAYGYCVNFRFQKLIKLIGSHLNLSTWLNVSRISTCIITIIIIGLMTIRKWSLLRDDSQVLRF